MICSRDSKAVSVAASQAKGTGLWAFAVKSMASESPYTGNQIVPCFELAFAALAAIEFSRGFLTLVITHIVAGDCFLPLALKGPWILAGGGGAGATTGIGRAKYRTLVRGRDVARA